MIEEKNENIWVICPECKTRLKKEHIATHMKHVHSKKIEDFDESSIKVLTKKEQKQKKPMHFSLNSIAVIAVIFAVILHCGFSFITVTSVQIIMEIQYPHG